VGEEPVTGQTRFVVCTQPLAKGGGLLFGSFRRHKWRIVFASFRRHLDLVAANMHTDTATNREVMQD
jgi:hypothetical protein